MSGVTFSPQRLWNLRSPGVWWFVCVSGRCVSVFDRIWCVQNVGVYQPKCMVSLSRWG